MGHEAAGVVETVGPGAEAWVPGTRVTFDSIVWCGECRRCRAGRTNLCEIRQTFGVSTPAFRRDGAMAEHVVVPQRLLHRLPDTVSFEAGSMVEPAAVAMHAARISGIVPGDLVVVVGAGLIGNLAMQAARTLGAGVVAVADISLERLALAGQLGGDLLINSAAGDLSTVLEEATGRRTADVVLEAVGIQATIDAATALTRPGGSLTLIGNVKPRVEQDLPGDRLWRAHHPWLLGECRGVSRTASSASPMADCAWPSSSVARCRSPTAPRPSRHCTAATRASVRIVLRPPD